MKRAIDASRAFTEILASQQTAALGRLDEIAQACTDEIATVQKETAALVHIVEDHGKAAVMRLTTIRTQVLRLAQEIGEGSAGPEQVAADLNVQKGVDAVRAAIDGALAEVKTLPVAKLTATGDGIEGEAA